jgi:hypothetical protein
MDTKKEQTTSSGDFEKSVIDSLKDDSPKPADAAPENAPLLH